MRGMLRSPNCCSSCQNKISIEKQKLVRNTISVMAGGICEEITKPQSNAISGLLFCEMCWELYETDAQCGNNSSVVVLRWICLLDKS